MSQVALNREQGGGTCTVRYQNVQKLRKRVEIGVEVMTNQSLEQNRTEIPETKCFLHGNEHQREQA